MTLSFQRHFPLKALNTFGIDARSDYFIELTECQQLEDLLTNKVYQAGPTLWLGGGSNILFTRNYRGLVVKLALNGIRVVKDEIDSIVVEAAAGENWHSFVCYTLQNGWYGLENLSLIPGTVGACPIQNIGAYGVEVKEYIHQVVCADLTQGGAQRILNSAECNFSYRDSIFKHEEGRGLLVTAVRFRLFRTPTLRMDYGEIREVLRHLGKAHQPTPLDISQAVIHMRTAKLPDPKQLGNAGSFFKNPILPVQQAQALIDRLPNTPYYPAHSGFIKLAAGWLIEQTGFKGYREGEVGVHQHQALVLVNYGSASGLAIKALADKIIDAVRARFGITLEPEPLIL